jgi:hypothetical protein
VDAWWEDGFDPLLAARFVDDLVEALSAHARFLDLDRIVLPRATRHRQLARQVRDRLGTGGRVNP